MPRRGYALFLHVARRRRTIGWRAAVDRAVEPLLIEPVGLAVVILGRSRLVGVARLVVIGPARLLAGLDRVAVGIDQWLVVGRRVPDLVVAFGIPVRRRGAG